VQNLNEAVLEWQTANYIVSKQCQKATADSAEVFNVWNHHIPILNTYLSNESKIHYSIYLSAQLLGLFDELDAQKDISQILQVKSLFSRSFLDFLCYFHFSLGFYG
jgi:hypothetical protein